MRLENFEFELWDSKIQSAEKNVAAKEPRKNQLIKALIL